ncbi:MAG: hypothetical protein WDA09_02230 [Bacteriovoracaceae bacterium]
MFTIALAWINAKYKAGYELLFFGTVMIDLAAFEALGKAFGS